jgi:hypothetical protein
MTGDWWIGKHLEQAGLASSREYRGIYLEGLGEKHDEPHAE